MGKPLTTALQALEDYANAATGKSEPLDEAIRTLVEGYGQGGGNSLYEKGEVSFHTGSSLNVFSVPVSDASFDNYAIRAVAVRSWVYDGGWAERESLDFTDKGNGVYQSVLTPFIMSFTGGVNFPITASTAGGTLNLRTNGYGPTAYIYTNKATATWESAAQPIVKNGNIISSRVIWPICDEHYGLTFAYEVWGWNNG